MVFLVDAKTACLVQAPIKVSTKSFKLPFFLNMEAQQILIAENFFPTSWMKIRNNKHDLNLCSSINLIILLCWRIDVFISLGDRCSKQIFNIKELLSVHILLETNRINKYINSIYPAERKLTAVYLRTIATISCEPSDQMDITATATMTNRIRIIVTTIRLGISQELPLSWELPSTPQCSMHELLVGSKDKDLYNLSWTSS